MDTLCRDCVFAEWHGNKQAGCEFDRLEKFEDRGATVTLEEDEGKLYGRIVGRICNTCRSEEAMSDIPARDWKTRTRHDVIPNVAMAVYVDGDSQYIEACRSLKSIANQSINPMEIILIYNVNGADAPSEYPIWMTTVANHLAWRIQTIKSIPGGDAYGESIDLVVKDKQMKATYFTVCKAGYEYPIDYIETIDRAINDELLRFVALLPDEDGNGLFIQRGLHNYLQGNKMVEGCRNVIDKIKVIAQEEGTDHMIKRFEEIVG